MALCAAALCVAGMAQSHIHLRFTWQATIFHIPSFTHNFVTHYLSHTTLSHTIFHTPSFTHNFVTNHLSHTTLSHTIFHTQLSHTPSFTHVAQSHVHLRFAWQASHNLTSTFVLRGRRGTYGTVWRAWSPLVAGDAAALCVAGVAQSHIHLRVTWQAWHNLTSTFVLRGRRGTYGTVWRAWSPLVAGDAAALCVAGVAQSHIHLCVTWQAWHNLTSTFVLRGRRGTYGTVWRAWSPSGDAAALCVAGVAQSHIHLCVTWQAWHNLTSTFVLRGRRGTYGTVWRAWSPLVAGDAAALCVAGVAQSHIHLCVTWQAWHNLTSTFVLRGRRGHLWDCVARLVAVGRR